MIIKLIIEDFISPFAVTLPPPSTWKFSLSLLSTQTHFAHSLCTYVHFTAFAPLCTVWFRSRVRSILIGLLMASIKRTARAILT